MATVKDILAVKGSWVETIASDRSVLDAALLMNERRIGSLVVTEEGTVRGIISERDVLRRVVAERRDPTTTPIRDVMSRDLVCCAPHTSVEEARVALKDRRIRHLPVMENGQLCGMISIGDLNAHEAHSKEQTIHLLQTYIYGTP